MYKKILTAISVLLMVALTACSGSPVLTSSISEVANSGNTTVTENQDSTITSEASSGATSVDVMLAENDPVHTTGSDPAVDSSAVIPIVFSDDSIQAAAEGVIVSGSTVTVTRAGAYRLSGSLADGQVLVDTADEEIVQLILDGVDITNRDGAALAILNAAEVLIRLSDGTENHLSDGETYLFPDADVNEPNAALFSSADLTILGGGSLVVYGNYHDGIASKDGLVIASGTITVEAADDGIRGKDYLVIQGGDITIQAQGDGLKADNAEDTTRGYILVEAGSLTVEAGGDAINAQTDVGIRAGTFKLTSGSGSNSWANEDSSTKGIKGATSVTIDGGTFIVDTADDAVHSNGDITINGGSFQIATGDDGMHADANLIINAGEVEITQAFEGLESAVITINGGEISMNVSDDGINVAGGKDGSGTFPGMLPGAGGQPDRAGPGQDAFAATGNYHLYIHGGYIYIQAVGDGLDVNGSVDMTAGLLLVDGPIEQMNSALDYDGYFTISGGTLVAVGSAGMAMAPGATSSQNSLLVNFTSTLPAGSLIHIQNSAGESLLTFSPSKQIQSIAFSSPDLEPDSIYSVYLGGSATGEFAGGYYQNETYTPGSEYTSFSLASVTTQIGSSGGGPGWMRP